MNIKRPIGITIIAILIMVNGSFLLFSGIATLILIINFTSSDLLNTVPFTLESNNTNFQITNSDILKNINYLLTFIAGIIMLFSFLHFVIAYGLFKGKSWARISTIIISSISIIANIIIILVSLSIFNTLETILGGTIITILINSLIIYYLFRKEVRDYFHHKGPSYSLDDLR